MDRGPCAKRVVTATLVTAGGETFVGTNHCFAPQTTCPRGAMPAGVGYELCQDVCMQPAHAEENAIAAAGDAVLHGARMFVEGIDWVCGKCSSTMSRAGVTVILGAPCG